MFIIKIGDAWFRTRVPQVAAEANALPTEPQPLPMFIACLLLNMVRSSRGS